MTRTRRLISTISIVTVFSIGLAACTLGDEKKPAATQDIQANQQGVTQDAVGQLISKRPTYQPKDSAERANNNERLKRWENVNKIGYITVLAMDGTLVYYGTIKGKVSSINSHNSNDEDVRWVCKTNHGCQPVVVHSPDLDGSWGDNPDGIFFIDSAGGYHEFMGTYIIHVADVPTKLTQQPKLQIEANATPTPNK